MHRPEYSSEDFGHSPLVVFYELTQACDLACKHCRACAQPLHNPDELSTAQAGELMAQLASFPKPPLLVLTGGDPLKRDDLFQIIGHARRAGLSVAITPSATPLATADAVARLRDAGVSRLAVSLDGCDAATHDNFRGVAGSFAQTLAIIEHARALNLPVQINTTITRHNVDQVDAIAQLLAPLGIVLWSVFFLVPVGRGQSEQRITAQQCEEVFDRLYEQARRQPFAIKTTEAPHYRRYTMQRAAADRRASVAAGEPVAPPRHGPGQPPRSFVGTNDGKGVMFISHTGMVYPSGFIPIAGGQFPRQSVVDIYQNAPIFQQLRQPDELGGKCGVCEFRTTCGGSRARAFALTGNPLAAEPDCVYQPIAITRNSDRGGAPAAPTANSAPATASSMRPPFSNRMALTCMAAPAGTLFSRGKR